MRSFPITAVALTALATLGIATVGLRAAPSADWSECSAVAFGGVAEALLERGPSADEFDALRRALDDASAPQSATRAATILGAIAADTERASARREASRGALVAHLSARRPATSRGAEGPAIVAAKALGLVMDGEIAGLLASLATGPGAHPDLAVRVECAAAVVEERTDEVAPFLLSVLRAETPDQAKSPRSWERITTLAWVKTRAARALSDAAELPMRFRPDGSWAHQMDEANRLEAALR